MKKPNRFHPDFIVVFLIASLFACFSCNEIRRIKHEAKDLFKDSQGILTSSLNEAAQVGMLAINETFRHSTDPEVIRFVAKSTAKVLADEAVKIVLMKQVDKLNTIFGIDHSEAVCSMLLATYCYPILNDIIDAAIERKLREMGSAFDTRAKQPSIDSIVNSYLKEFDLDDAIDIVKAFGKKEKMPEYFSAIGINPVNNSTYASTRNWKDHGLVYQYRIVNHNLEMRRSDNPWQTLAIPHERKPRNIAADNNRLFVLTENNELWWYCVKKDQAQWSIDIMNEAVKAMALKPVVGELMCGRLTPLFSAITDSVAAAAAKSELLQSWKTGSGGQSKSYWENKCTAWSDMVLSIDKLVLKNPDGTSFTAGDYSRWSQESHQEGSWVNLLTWGAKEHPFHRGQNIPVDSIVDIAVGNWNGTVVTMYVLAFGKVWFIDEEIIHPLWKPIEKWNSKWAVFGTEYREIGETPYPLDSTCRIDASNSVVAVAKNSQTGAEISWIRWDYHQKDDFIYWPLDWCEHSWHVVSSSVLSSGEFRIGTTGPIDPRENSTVWSIPAPAFTFHTFLPQEGYKGIFGDVPREEISNYPVNIFVKGIGDTVRYFSADQAKNIVEREVEWMVY